MTSARPSWVTHPVIATVLGALAAGLTVMLVESAGHAVLGAGNPRSPSGITMTQYLAVLVAWILGVVVGALVATRWARTTSVIPGVVVGALILLGAVGNFTAFAHPTWMMVASASLPFIGFAAARAARPAGPRSR